MATPITVTVTQDDIEKGRRADCTRCPVALALLRVTGKRWGVGEDRATCVEAPETVALTGGARRFIGRFDNRLRVQPFTFIASIEALPEPEDSVNAH